MTDQKIIEKLGKIKAHMESAKEIGNEHEAQAFAAMLQNLLAKHKLEMSDVQYSSHLQDEPVEEYQAGGDVIWDNGRRVYKNYPDVEVLARRIEWIEDLAGIIAEAHSCKIMVSPGSSRIWLVGRKLDCQVAEYLFITMQRIAEKLSHKEYKKFRAQCRALDNGGGAYLYRTHGFKASFLTGFILRLQQRFTEEKAKMQRDYSGTALMRINKEALAVREYLDKKKNQKKAPALGGHSQFNSEGYKRGQATADGLRIDSNAVTGSNKDSQKYLG